MKGRRPCKQCIPNGCPFLSSPKTKCEKVLLPTMTTLTQDKLGSIYCHCQNGVSCFHDSQNEHGSHGFWADACRTLWPPARLRGRHPFLFLWEKKPCFMDSATPNWFSRLIKSHQFPGDDSAKPNRKSLKKSALAWQVTLYQGTGRNELFYIRQSGFYKFQKRKRTRFIFDRKQVDCIYCHLAISSPSFLAINSFQ